MSVILLLLACIAVWQLVRIAYAARQFVDICERMEQRAKLTNRYSEPR